VLRNARRALAKATGRRASQLRRAVDELSTTLQRTATSDPEYVPVDVRRGQ
jgi:hypothetical protein